VKVEKSDFMNDSLMINSGIDKNKVVKHSGFFSFQFDIPFQLPLPKGINVGSITNRKCIITREKYLENNEIKKYYSTIEIVSFLLSPYKLEITKNYLEKKLIESIDHFNYFIKCLINKQGINYPELRLISKQDLTQRIQYFYVNSQTIKSERIKSDYYRVRKNDPTLRPVKMLSKKDLQFVADYFEVAYKDPLFEITSYYYEAIYAQKHGFYQEAIIKLGTHMEMFIYKITEFLMINEKMDEKKISNTMNSNNYGCVIDTQFSRILEQHEIILNREKEGNDFLEYWNNLYLLRCNTVHKGKVITKEETILAFDSAQKVIADIAFYLSKDFFDKSIYDFSYLIKFYPSPIVD